MNLPIDKKSLETRNTFNVFIDLFLGAWASFEMTVDFAIGKFLKTTHEQTHLITAGMMFGRRARLLDDLVGRSDHPRKTEILGAFNKLRGMSTKGIFVQCCRWSNEEEGHVLERSADGRFKIKSRNFAEAEFMDCLRAFAAASSDFYLALEITGADIRAFGAAAESLSDTSKM